MPGRLPAYRSRGHTMNRQHTSHLANELVYSLWLVFDADGTVRSTRSKPSLGRNERGMQLSVTLPKALFKTPELAATIKIESPTSDPVTIDASAAAEALSASLGMPVDIRIVEPNER